MNYLIYTHFLLVTILPLVPMDHRFDESYPFVYIGHVWQNEANRQQEKQRLARLEGDLPSRVILL